MAGKITSLSISNWYGTSFDASFTFQHDNGSLTHKLDKEDVEKIWAVAYAAIERTKHKIAEEIKSIEPPALLGYDREKTIEGGEVETPPRHLVADEEIPF